MSPESLLEFGSVAVTVDGTRILESVSIDVGSGRMVVLVGPSGAGKSTLLRLGDRLDVPSAGVVRLDGIDLAQLDVREVRRSVGMVFQRPSIFPGTVRDNLLVADRSSDERSLATALERVGLDAALLDRVADGLSGGERQRLCIARALRTEPRILLLDEPTSSLDPASRAEIETLVAGLVADGIGALWVTHDLAQARRLADEIHVLIDGRIATGDLRDRYLRSGDHS